MRSRVLIVLAFLVLWKTPLAAAPQEKSVAPYRSNTPDLRVRSVPAETQQGVFTDPERYVGPLVQSLTQGVSDEFLRVKILHDWVAENIGYDVESFLSGVQVDTAWAETLRRRKSVCHGYASVMVKMCELAGIRCETVSGYGRGYGFLAGQAGQAENVNQTNHAWNAVHLGGNWRLLDATWDAGHVHERAFHKSYGTTYLFAEPREFLYTHFPGDAKWQLLNPPLTAEQFADLPYLPGQFFDHGMRLTTALGRVTRAGQTVQFSVEVPEDIAILVRLRTAVGQELPRRTLVQRTGRECKILLAFPQAGRWTVYLHSKRRGEPGQLDLAASLEFESTAGTASTFPMTYAAYDDLLCCLYRPLFVPLAADQSTLFELGIRGTGEVHLVLGNKWQRMKPHPNVEGVFQLTALVPPGASATLVTKDPSGSGYITLVDFTAAQK